MNRTESTSFELPLTVWLRKPCQEEYSRGSECLRTEAEGLRKESEGCMLVTMLNDYLLSRQVREPRRGEGFTSFFLYPFFVSPLVE